MPQLLIIGSPHLDNPGRDIVNLKIPDVLQPPYQKEILKIVKSILKFKPTKVAVETVWEKENELQSRYRDFLNGKYTLSRNEVDQIAFRVAKEMGHEKIYAVDTFEMPDVEEDYIDFLGFAKENGMEDFLKELQTIERELQQRDSEALKNAGLIGLFRLVNSPDYSKFNHSVYLKIATVGKPGVYPGASWVQFWYGRNLKIFAHLTWLVESPDERIFLLIGAGHLYLLSQFARESRFFDLKPPTGFLP